MKNLLLLLLITISFRSYSQQPFSPPGAVWHYDYHAISEGGFIKIEYIGDTVIQSIVCKQLQPTRYAWFLINPNTYGHYSLQLPSYFIYQNADTIFWLNNNQFKVLYNFNSMPGTTWTVTDSMDNGMMDECDSLSNVFVDSTGIENINSENLKYLSVHPDNNSPLGFYGRIYERLGNMHFMFPEYTHCDTSIIADTPFYFFHCYEDNTFALYNADTTDCEWWWTLNIDKTAALENTFSIFPNPAGSFITVDSRIAASSLSVFNSFGQQVFSQNLNGWLKGFRIDTEKFSEGIYFVRLMTEAGTFTKSFLKL